MKRHFLFALLLICIAESAWAAPTDPSLQSIFEMLRQQILKEEQIADLYGSQKPAVDPTSDLPLLDDLVNLKLGVKPAMSPEGLPEIVTPLRDASDVIDGAYTATAFLKETIKLRETITLNEKLNWLEDRAARAIRISKKEPTEIYLRLTLNRCVDVVHFIAPIAGLKSQAMTQVISSFYSDCFDLALALGNNKFAAVSRFSHPDHVAKFIKAKPIAEYGRIFSVLVDRVSQQQSLPDAAKAVVLMRLLGYLGWDLNADLRRSQRPIAMSIADIYELQTSDLYGKILSQLMNPGPPTPEELTRFHTDLVRFRARVAWILKGLPERFKEAGVE